jgi:hypothetical protein
MQHRSFLVKLGWDAHALTDPHLGLLPNGASISGPNAAANRTFRQLQIASSVRRAAAVATGVRREYGYQASLKFPPNFWGRDVVHFQAALHVCERCVLARDM